MQVLIYGENVPLCVPFINLYKSNRCITLDTFLTAFLKYLI